MNEKQSAQTEGNYLMLIYVFIISDLLFFCIFFLEDLMEIDEFSSSVEINAETTSSKRVRGQKTIITPKLVCALNNFKISNKGAICIIIAVVEALGENLVDFVINRTSIQRC